MMVCYMVWLFCNENRRVMVPFQVMKSALTSPSYSGRRVAGNFYTGVLISSTVVSRYFSLSFFLMYYN
jgi:hypothetical protein